MIDLRDLAAELSDRWIGAFIRHSTERIPNP
jgi:hypothetical protein